MTSTSTRPSQPPSAVTATSESTSTNSKLPLQVSQDGELLGDERFIRRLFVPEDLESASEPISQSRLTLHSSHESSSRRSSVEVKLTIDMNPAPGDEANGKPLAGNSQQPPLGAEGFSESIRMIDLPDVRGKYHAESLSSGSGRLSSSSSSAQHQMPQQQQQQQKQQQQQHFDTNDTCKFTFEKVFQKTFLGVNQSFLIAKKKKISSEEIAIRIRSGSGGRSEWLNELQVYLIPNFRHANILDYLGSEQDSRGSNRRRSSGQRVLNELPRISDIRGRTYLLDSTEEQRAKELKENEAAVCRDGAYIRLQYWLMNRFDGCIVLRDYLREQALEWPQLILIARGIVDGLHYLHENGDYQGIDKEEAARNFVKSTRGALRRVAFIDKNSRIMMWPHHTCSIIHRNLSSMNVVLKGPELRPCIWNFGHSKIHHPFQPTNHINLIDQGLKQVFMSSPYSSPEVLQERAYLTLTAMKSIDMYACGILFWELLSRCRLPKLAGATEFEDLERSEPDRYYEPFEYEFGPNPSTAMLAYAVCRLHARPKLKESWLVGQKTYSFSQTIQDLWDQDYDARVHTSTVMDRLERIDTSGEDSRHIFTSRNSRSFNLQTDWPPKIDSIQVPPFLIKCEPNLVLLD